MTAAERLPLYPSGPPLRLDEGGAVGVGNSRISLDLVVEHYENGVTPEEMVRVYDTLVLADVYAVVAYYLRHPDEVRVYLKRRAEEAGALRAKLEAEHPRVSREELLARRSARKKANAPAGEAPLTGGIPAPRRPPRGTAVNRDGPWVVPQTSTCWRTGEAVE